MSALSFFEARDRLLALARPLGLERVALDEADERVLGEDIASHVDIPDADKSAMDGYAVATRDLGGGPFQLPVAGEARPGGPILTLGAGHAARIFTGAVMPAGADAVVIQEDVTTSERGIDFARAPKPGANVRRRGEDLASGAIALARGTRLGPSKLGLLASLDRPWVAVARRPRVMVISTGDELRLPGSAARAGSVAESGSIVVRAMARRAGAEASVHPMVGDDENVQIAAFDSALRTSDLLVTIGGMGVGDHDLVRPVLDKLGVTLDFWKVAIKPGKPVGVGHRGTTLVLGLPGNPAAAATTFALFGVPLLRALQGDRAPVTPTRVARLGAAVSRKAGRMEFMRATLSRAEDGQAVATPFAHQSSGSVAGPAHADCLVVIPEHVAALDVGALVDVYDFV